MEITRQEFSVLYRAIQENFKGMESISKMQRCFGYVSELPQPAVKEIIEDMIDNERFAPLPVDFEKKASAWKRNFFLKNGYYYGETGTQVISEKIDCDWCLDTGLTKIVHHAKSEFAKLMRCSCERGNVSGDVMPKWDNELQAAYRREKLTIDWFNPKIDSSQSEETQFYKIYSKVEEWQQIKLKSSNYWIDLGYKYGIK